MKGPNMFDRPRGAFSLAERRIELAALAGPMRVLHGSSREFTLPTQVANPESVMVSENGGSGSYALYVELRPRTTNNAPLLIVGGQQACDPSASITVDLSIAPFLFQYVLLPGERLFARNIDVQNAAVFVRHQARV